MGGMTIRIVSIEPPWFEEKAQVQSCTWRELNQGHIPQGIVDAITPEFALKLTRSHAKDPNQVVLVALENNHVIGFAELLQTPRSPIKRSEAAELASLYVLDIIKGIRPTRHRQRSARLVGRRIQHQRPRFLPSHRLP